MRKALDVKLPVVYQKICIILVISRVEPFQERLGTYFYQFSHKFLVILHW